MGDNKNEQTYNLDDLLSDCKSRPSNVGVSWLAKKGASGYLNLLDHTEICEFLGNRGMEDPIFINTVEWENFQGQGPKVPMVDAYEFLVNKETPVEKCAYLAFLRLKNGKWLIKSLKKQDEQYKLSRGGRENKLTYKAFSVLEKLKK